MSETLRGWPADGSPFHAMSLAIQRKLGVAERIETFALRGVTPTLTAQHREFFAQLPLVVAGTVDADGQPWATILCGMPGFMHAPEPGSLRIGALPLPGDPLAQHFVPGAPIGLLGIEPATRRRNRVNGRIAARDTDSDGVGFTLEVEQAFGNCPKYIRNRTPHAVEMVAPQRTHLPSLDEAARSMIQRADTYFIASAFRDVAECRPACRGVDVSHRGGKPGFVRIDANGTLTVPDFVGNFQFRTIGNLSSEPRAGLLFPDFASGEMLYLAVDAEVIWDGPEVKVFAGAERLLRFHVREMVRLTGAMSLRFDEGEASPFLERTGNWAGAGSCSQVREE